MDSSQSIFDVSTSANENISAPASQSIEETILHRLMLRRNRDREQALEKLKMFLEEHEET